ncbi:MAG: hypothetical protein ABIY63_18160 [Fibrobacteria bacterium]
MNSEQESQISCCYKELVLEMPGEEKKANQKIQRRLRYLGLPKATPETLELLRNIRDQLSKEIGLFDKSKYHLGYTRNVTAFEDFDSDRMLRDFQQLYPSIPEEEMGPIIGFSIFAYYLR